MDLPTQPRGARVAKGSQPPFCGAWSEGHTHHSRQVKKLKTSCSQFFPTTSIHPEQSKESSKGLDSHTIKTNTMLKGLRTGGSREGGGTEERKPQTKQHLFSMKYFFPLYLKFNCFPDQSSTQFTWAFIN